MIMNTNPGNKKPNLPLNEVTFLVGDVSVIREMIYVPVKAPFDEYVMDFLDTLGRKLTGIKDARKFPDIVVLGYWMCRTSTQRLKELFLHDNGNIHQGRGIVFHIAPSNVPVIYMYSLVAGLLTGNANIVRVPSRNFPLVAIINDILKDTMDEYDEMRQYIALVRYGKNKNINDYFSSVCDVRIIWGGDNTIDEIRKSPLAPRTTEITFADRYSLSIIDSVTYLDMSDKEKKRLAVGFYNDTFFSDQNACTSPRLIAWLGDKEAGEKARDIFWKWEHELVKKRYDFQPIMAVNKMEQSYLVALDYPDAIMEKSEDNFITRILMNHVEPKLMTLKGNSGFFFETDIDTVLELKNFCDDRRCQTLGYLGDIEKIKPLLNLGIKGVDRVVPIGYTMNFELIWDGYNLVERMTRCIRISN